MPTIHHLNQRLAIYADGSSAANCKPNITVHLDPVYPSPELEKVLELIREAYVTPLVIYQDFKGKIPAQLEDKMEFAESFDLKKEMKRLGKVFK